ncbi:MAG TPA: hypothetical protein VNR39_12425 [Pseudolabrys sp.]|nr:hypothetical protein [Pseudolabrys sp.]
MTTEAASPATEIYPSPLNFELRKPETVFGDHIAALDLREPTAATMEASLK